MRKVRGSGRMKNGEGKRRDKESGKVEEEE